MSKRPHPPPAISSSIPSRPSAAVDAAAPPPPAAPADWIAQRLREAGRFDALLGAAEKHRLQIFVSEVHRQPGGGPPRLTDHRFRVDAEYIYPASAIKTLLSVAVLRQVAHMRSDAGRAIGTETPLARCRGGACTPIRDASNSSGGVATLGHEIRKMQLVSDNQAFATLYNFVGHRELNEALHRLGFASVRMRHRMGGTEKAGRTTPRVDLLLEDGTSLTVPQRHSDLTLERTPAAGIRVGEVHLDDRGAHVAGPRDFGDRNYVSLADLHRLTVTLALPDAAGAMDLQLLPEHRALLISAMTDLPSRSTNPRYSGQRHAARLHKPMLPGIVRALGHDRVRYMSKSGRAYGFHVDTAYVEVLDSKRAMVVTAAIYANSDGVINDDSYDYDTVSAPFFDDLGEVLARALLVVE